MKKYLLLLFVTSFFGDYAIGQMLKSTTECETILGEPIKVHSTTPPARLYLYNGLHVQISYEEGKAIAAIYRIPSPTGNSLISESKINDIFSINGFSQDDLIDMDSQLPYELRGLYKSTRDKKIIVLNDPKENVIVMYELKTLLDKIKNNN
ncbi:MAG: hypothetical protein KGR46_08800 [Verrucomicrobia bacterium]|nr:hypothetical protein [Verrucomicrobiota bacterium]